MSRLDELKVQRAQLDGLIRNGVLTGEAARQARDRLEAQIVAAVEQHRVRRVRRVFFGAP